MRRTSRGRGLLLIVTLALVAAAGCHESSTGSSTIQRPTPVSPGSPVAGTKPATKTIGGEGGTIASPDGRLTVNVPAGAVSADTLFSIQEITNNAPLGIGSAYRLDASGAKFATPVAITFRTDQISTPTQNLAVVFQNEAGYWVPVLSALRNTAAKLITARSSHFSDWTLVPSDPTKDMAGQFTVTSTLDAPSQFTAVGTAGMAYAGEDSVETAYLFTGTTTLQPPTVNGTACTTTNPTYTFPTNIAELFKSPPNFEWGTSALWSLSCGGVPSTLTMVFDTAGISHVGCARGYTTGAAAPVATQDTVSGDYTIDCTSQGRGSIRASWAFQRCGGPCTSTNSCATAAAYSCGSGTPVCTVTQTAAIGTACTTSGGGGGVCSTTGVCTACTQGAACTTGNPCAPNGTIDCSSGGPVCNNGQPVTDGTSCGTNLVCSSGVCQSCTAGVGCTSSNPCAATAVTSCSTGVAVCTDSTFLTAGTACPALNPTGVCNTSGVCTACTQGAACTTGNPCAPNGTIDCSSGGPVCKNGQPVTDGTSCGTNLVCSSGVCQSCTANVACTSSNPCAATAVTSCSTGVAVCTDSTFLAAGTACPAVNPTGVCNTSGVCTACIQGAPCTSSNPCVTSATIDCSTGVPVCKDGTGSPAGTACTTSDGSGVCSGDPTNTCTACTPGTVCTSTNPCATAASTVCSSGAPVCTDTAFSPDATVCNSTTNSVCLAGTCAVCSAGLSCVPANPCDVGTLSCGDPTAIPPTPPGCVDTGVAITCPAGQTCNPTTGICG